MQFSTLYFLLLTLSVSPPAFAGEIEEKVAKAMATEYAKEQLKHQLAEFLNKNPRVVFSTNPTIGTKSIRFMSETLAVYGFLTAKSDRERAWSATSLILTPEPTTAAILFAVQLADTILTLKAQEALAGIYREIAEINAQTIHILAQVRWHEYESQRRILEDFDRTMDQIEEAKNRLDEHPVNLYLTKPRDGMRPPTANEIQEAIGILNDLSLSLTRLDMTTLMVEAVFTPEILGLPKGLTVQYASINQTYDPLRKQIHELNSAFAYFFASLNSELLKRQIKQELEPYVTVLRIYKTCVQKINSAATSSFWKKRKYDFDSNEFINECRNRFSMKGILPL